MKFLNLKNLPLGLISVLSDAIVFYFAVSLLAVFLGSDEAEPFLFCLKVLILIYLCLTLVRKSNVDVRDLFTVRQFLARLTVIAVSAALIGKGGRMAEDYTLVIVFTSAYLFGLIRVRRYTYVGGGNDKKRSFIEYAITLAIVLSAFLFVSPAAASTLKAVSSSLYSFVSKLLSYILIPAAWLITVLAGMISGMFSGSSQGGGGSSAGEAAKLPDYSGMIKQSFLENISGILLYIIFAAAAFLVIFLSLRRFNRRKVDTDTDGFKEERESVLNLKGNMKKRLKRLGKSLEKGFTALNRLNADNTEKLRHEYRKLLHTLNKEGVLKGEVTADTISKRLAGTYYDAGPDIRSLTVMYEETRYGRKLPTDEEYRDFKRRSGNIVKIVGKSR